MFVSTRSFLMAGLLGLLVACGGGGGNSAPGVEPEPPGDVAPPQQPEPPETNPSPYAEAEQLLVFITGVSLNGDNQAEVQIQLTDGENVPILDLEVENLRFVISKLQGSPLGNLTGTWQSYINQIDIPEVDIGTQPRLQATTENDGLLTNNGDGIYVYRYATSLTNLPQDMLDQAETEGLSLAFEPERTHRVVIQFDGAKSVANPHYDWVPATGATQGIFTKDIVAIENCNVCHDPLAIHNSGRRQEIKYCVSCHNPGTTDSDSTNTVDLKVMVHKIHRGANLPSVQAGGKYVIYGGSGTPHDYSELEYPQDIRNCVNCHVGTGTVGEREDLVLTSQGDNWNEVPTQAACGSCHDDLDFTSHAGGQTDDLLCASCHSLSGPAGTIAGSHRMLLQEAREAFEAEVLSVSSTGPGEIPVAIFKVSNPLTGEDYDILNDPVWTNDDASLSILFAWSTSDYTNTGNGSDSASSISANALADAVDNGDGSYSLSAPLAIPDGSEAPGIAATGSGVAVIEGRAGVELEQEGVNEQVPLTSAHRFFSIDESDGTPVPRRVAVTMDNCLSCHGTLTFHRNNRTDNIDSCVTCHNARFYSSRNSKPLDLKVIIHTLHGDEEQVSYPGNIANCVSCHTDSGYTLPLADSVLATTVDPGEDLQDPTDDIVTTPVTAVCASCHADTVAQSHMTSNGGRFDTTQGAIDSGEVVEECSVCHASGRIADVAEVHDIP